MEIQYIYGAKRIKIFTIRESIWVNNYTVYISQGSINTVSSIEFPIINNKSPNKLTFSGTLSEKNPIIVIIEEFGGTPSDTYFEDGE